jgi:hypothetical protein
MKPLILTEIKNPDENITRIVYINDKHRAYHY